MAGTALATKVAIVTSGSATGLARRPENGLDVLPPSVILPARHNRLRHDRNIRS